MTNYGPEAIIAVSVVFAVLATVAVGLRFYTRATSKVALAADDWLMPPSLALVWIIASLLIWGAATESLGHTLPPPTVKAPGFLALLMSNSEQQMRMNQIQYHVDWMAVLTLGMLKTSLLIFYRRIFCPTGRQNIFSIATIAMLAVVAAWTLGFGLALILRCGSHPEAERQSQFYISTHCAGPALREGYATSDFIMDVLIWVLPLPKVWSLHMPTRKKVAVALVFLIGIFAIAASGARMGIYYGVLINWLRPTDGELLVSQLMFWTMIEVGSGLVVVCLPTIRSLAGEASLGKILSGIRSAVSMRSLRSQGSQDGARRRPSSKPRSSGSDSDRDHHDLRVKNEGTTYTHVSVSDVEAQRTAR